ncbi:MAG: right-handed parallel beta-helix repeat-containing protein, partial [Planctomycetota bacterium]
ENADTLILDPNTYYEVINFNNKPVHLRSTDPNDPNVVASTIIDANNTSLDVAVFNSGEDANSVIDGITLTGGRYGLYCTSSSAPTVQRCVMRNNSGYGVNAASASPTISDCEIRQNNDGLYLNSSATALTRCRILSNTYRGIYGLSYSGPIRNCVIAKNNTYGIYFTYPTAFASVINCTIVSNTTAGISGDCDQVENCIVWGNGNDLGTCTATYSCIEDQDAGTGNLHALPLFVDADNDDYHLWYSSSCIDAGDPNSVYANEPNGGGGRINIGAYGNTAEATTIVDQDSDGLADAWEETYWPGEDPNLHDPNDDPDADGLRNKDEYYVNWDPNSDDSASIDGLVCNSRMDVNLPSISLALTMAENADTLILDPNTYYEVINFNNKPVHLRSTDPNDNTSLDVAVFNSGEDANSILDGITLTGGHYGIHCTSSSAPTVQRCVIRNNSISGVFASSASPTISDCEIHQNSSDGMYLNGAASVTRCRIHSNTNRGIYGISYSGTVQNCVIAKNGGYGLYCQSSSASVINCSIVSNTTYGIYGACAEVKNCVVWGNTNDLHSCTADYSCIEDQDAGTGNLHALPLFVDADANDYHLWYSSPCIDAGDPNSVYANEPNGGGGRIDMGAYGNTAEATTIVDEDSDGLADAWEETYWPGQDPNLHDPNDDPDGDGLRNKDEYYVYWDPNSDDSDSVIGIVRNERVDVNCPSISLALATAANGDTLILESGTFYENVDFNGKPVHLRSTNPADPNVVAATIIDANGVGNGVTFSNAEDANSIIQGLTIRNAESAWQYAGINCTDASPSIRDCVLRNNYSGIYTDNSAAEITDCQGIYNSNYGLFIRYSSSPTISGGIFNNNGTYGAYFTNSSAGVIRNSIMAKNSNAGLSTTSDSTAMVFNCTIADNTTYGINASSTTEVENCILWNNSNDLYGCSATFSCIEDADAGRGNIHVDPLFQDA